MTTDTRTEPTPGPMEAVVLNPPHGIESVIAAAKEQDAIRADLLAALEALTAHLEDEMTLAQSQDAIYPGEDALTELLLTADAAIARARGEE